MGVLGNVANVFLPCFAAGTPLLTPTGSKLVEDIEAGDLLLASPEDDPEGPVHPRVVEEVFVRASPLLALRVCGREIRTTNEHPFYVQGKGWVKAWLLSPGDLLRTADGRWLPVESIADTGDVATVYNFRVAEYHTYYVGSPHWGFAVWSHNSNCARGAGVPGDEAPSDVFRVGKHGEMPIPRAGRNSHHGVMSAWVGSHFSRYDPDLAPAVLMPRANHEATFGVYNTWRAAMRQAMGGTFKWERVSEAQMRALSERMFDAATVPLHIRQQYWSEFERMLAALS